MQKAFADTVSRCGSSINTDNAAAYGAFDCVLCDSLVEKQFARDSTVDERVRFFLQTAKSFQNRYALGTYNPDWAVVFQGNNRMYFVDETKSSLLEKTCAATSDSK